jgi:hypothetical protein
VTPLYWFREFGGACAGGFVAAPGLFGFGVCFGAEPL